MPLSGWGSKIGSKIPNSLTFPSDSGLQMKQQYYNAVNEHKQRKVFSASYKKSEVKLDMEWRAANDPDNE